MPLFFRFFFLPYQIIKPVTGNTVGIKLTIKAKRQIFCFFSNKEIIYWNVIMLFHAKPRSRKEHKNFATSRLCAIILECTIFFEQNSKEIDFYYFSATTSFFGFK
jgi:hypothetical protein